MTDKTQEAWRAIQEGVDQLEEALLEKVKEEWVGTEEYWKDLDTVAAKEMSELSVFLSGTSYDEEGFGSGPVICIMPKSDQIDPSKATVRVTLEELLREEDDVGDDLPMWLDEMERLLRLFGRAPGG
jgi:hypothetical protein